MKNNKLTAEQIKLIQLDREDLNTVLKDDPENRGIIIAFIRDFSYYAEREWNCTSIDNEVIIDYFKSFNDKN